MYNIQLYLIVYTNLKVNFVQRSVYINLPISMRNCYQHQHTHRVTDMKTIFYFDLFVIIHITKINKLCITIKS